MAPDYIRDYASKIIESMRIDPKEIRPSSFAFSSKQAPEKWEAFTFGAPVPTYLVLAREGTPGQVRTLASGIKADNYILVASLGANAALVIKRAKKGENLPLFLLVRRDEDFERVANTLKKYDFISDELTAHSSVTSAYDELKGGAERYYTNRGVFSNYYLNDRLFPSLTKRGRNPQRESASLLAQFGGEFPIESDKVEKVLAAVGFELRPVGGKGHTQYSLRNQKSDLEVSCIATGAESLDTKTGDQVVPSFQAVASLTKFRWVILTNGRFWRLYTSRVQSSSTNYFEVDMEGVITENDQKLSYYVSLFSAKSFVPREQVTDVDITFEGGIQYATDVEKDLSAKIFDKQLFLNLVRGVVGHSTKKKYDQGELDVAKANALRLLYRLLFILYAEAKDLLPVNDKNYSKISLSSLSQRLPALEKAPESDSAWQELQNLFAAISKGRPEASVPVYDGALFEKDPELDSLKVRNEFLVPALRDLTEFEGRKIDYQNLGVRHLGSLYEALLEYSVRQADRDLVIYTRERETEILDASFASDIKSKPKGFIQQGNLYLTSAGFARKGTGSYFTPDELVTYLVKKGLGPHLEAKETEFISDLRKLASGLHDKKLENKTVDDLLGLRVVDPAMGSGHFLVETVNQITEWIISLLKENPGAPLQKQIEEDRQTIIAEQFKSGIKLDSALLTDTVILKRMVMKRCVYGVDVNPLAVELAKLSLWLDSFTIGTPLTFLDHHIRCGDALIGLWRENIAGRAMESTLDTWTGTLTNAVTTLFWNTSASPDITLEQVDQSRKSYEDVRERTESLRILLDVEVASIIDPELGKRVTKNVALIQKEYSKKQKPDWWGKVEEGCTLARKYRAFHWEFEFPEAFFEGGRGFDLVVMNPPWDAVKPKDDDFFSVYEPKIRRIPSKPKKRELIDTILKDPRIAKAYKEYKERIDQKLVFFKTSKEYVRRGTGDTDLWKLFLERSFKLLAKGGSLSVIIPSGIVAHEGAMQLREALYEGRIESMYEFENKYGIFPAVHRSYKFVLLHWRRTEAVDSFKAAFYLHHAKALNGDGEQEKFVIIPIALVEKCAPDTLSIPEPRNREQLTIFEKLYDSEPLLSDSGKGWTVALVTELHRTNDSDLFRSDGKGWPLIEGKDFHQFIIDYERPMFTVHPDEGLKRTSRVRLFAHNNEEIHRAWRLAFRDVARSTDVRSMICCILPPKTFSPNTAVLTIPQVGGSTPSEKEFVRMTGYLAGVMNSFVFDFLMRTRTTMHMNYFYVRQTPIPSKVDEGPAEKISNIAVRLNSTDPRYEGLAKIMGEVCGPLTMKERLELTAELNALVARHYGLGRKELDTILQSFEGFEEDKNLEKMDVKEWTESMIPRFNGEVRKRVLPYFDKLAEEVKAKA
jgi:Eco57I restriction-modification methylase